MMQKTKSRAIAWMAGAAVGASRPARCSRSPAHAQTKEPIKIGFSMAQTGPLGPNGKQALLGMKIWEEETNAKGGLLGRPVKLIYLRRPVQSLDGAGHLHQAARRRQSRPRARRLCDQHGRAGHAGRHAEEQDLHQPVRARCEREFKYPKYFSVLPTGPKTKPSFTEGFFQVAMQQNPKPTTVALTFEDAEFSQERLRGRARERQDLRPQDRLRQELSANDAPTSRRSCARYRPPMPISWWCAPIRSTRSAWCSGDQRSRTTSRR